MNILIQKLHKGIRVILKPILISAFITLSFQNPALANEDKDKIVALTNWATIAFSNLFFNSYSGPASGFGYRYTCFAPSNSCIGIQDGTNILDVLINGNIISIGPVANMIATMAASNNGIVNLTGTSVIAKIIPPVFSPGKGEATLSNGLISNVSWIVEAPTESCLLNITLNPADPSTVVNFTLSRVIIGSDSGFGQWTISNPGNTALPGISFDSASKTLTITANLVLERVEGGSDAITVAAGGTLKY
jgi:hypothetical protein